MQVVLFVLFLLTHTIVSSVDLPQSYIVLSDIGYYFEPIQIVEWLDDMFLSSFEECIHQCNENPLCHTFDYNVQPDWCRLFEAEPSPGQITYDSSLISRAGYVQLFPELYSAFNQTCDNCVQERYLFCIQNTCQCSWNSFWDGSICRKQKYAGSSCENDNECRVADYNLTCVVGNVCTSTGYPSNICSINQNTVLFSHLVTGAQPYTLYSFNFTAVMTSITVTFSLKAQSAYWLLDNVSMIEVNTSTSVLNNGGFETGDLTDWNYCNPNFTQNSSTVGKDVSGQYVYSGAPHPYPDFLSQTVSTIIENVYTLSFWLAYSANGPNNIFTVTLFS